MRILICVVAGIWGIMIPHWNLCWAIGDVGIEVERVSAEERGIDRCKYCGKFINPGNVHGDAVMIMQNKLKMALTDRTVGYVEGKEKMPYINILIYRYEERKGGNFAVEKPASIGFHMHLINNSVLKKVFVYEEDQQALMENLLTIGKFVKRGGKWVTVERLAEDGIEKGLHKLIEVAE
ncbi:MAG: hypothetical protein C0392_05195 [Syntrophus sp. (in: bacteria)]|nr:hypothetical protein [Syntrophus sp. (in: bacteria)]